MVPGEPAPADYINPCFPGGHDSVPDLHLLLMRTMPRTPGAV